MTIVLFIIAIALSFFAGNYMSDQAHREVREAHFHKYISVAINTAEGKGLSTDGAFETIASNIWAAHELCGSPEISAELSNLWNTLVYDKGTLIGQEDALVSQLKTILESYP